MANSVSSDCKLECQGSQEMRFFLSFPRYYVSGNRANIWVVEGRDRDLVIDAGLGLFNIAEYLDQCGLINPPRKPVLAVATHVHFDHSGG